MLRKLTLHNVGPRGDIGMPKVAPRLNLITGDNGLGKSFLLEAAWWALTRTWNGQPAVPFAAEATIFHHFDSESGISRSKSRWMPRGQYWKRKRGRPPNPGLVIYARVDGSFSVWDPARNYRLYTRRSGGEGESPSAYQFAPSDVLYGLKRRVSQGGREIEETLCLGLIDEWREWQRAGDPRFDLLVRLLSVLGPDEQPLEPGELRQPNPDDLRAVPTIRMPYGEDVPITYAPAGVRRMCKLAYLLAWVLSAHETECARLDIPPSRQVIVMVDELETHLHPRWQRTVLPSLMTVLDRWQDGSSPAVQFLVTTHSPLVLASAEPLFDPEQDTLWKLDLVGDRVEMEADTWHKRGDVGRWLRSDVFDLGSPTSVQAERAITRAGELLGAESPDVEAIRALDQEISDLFPAMDPFVLSWRHHVGPYLDAVDP